MKEEEEKEERRKVEDVWLVGDMKGEDVPLLITQDSPECRPHSPMELKGEFFNSKMLLGDRMELAEKVKSEMMA